MNAPAAHPGVIEAESLTSGAGLVTSKLAGDRLTKEMGTLLAEQNGMGQDI